MLDCRRDDTIIYIKSRIKLGFPSQQLRDMSLAHSRRPDEELANNMTLSQCGIHDGDMLLSEFTILEVICMMMTAAPSAPLHSVFAFRMRSGQSYHLVKERIAQHCGLANADYVYLRSRPRLIHDPMPYNAGLRSGGVALKRSQFVLDRAVLPFDYTAPVELEVVVRQTPRPQEALDITNIDAEEINLRYAAHDHPENILKWTGLKQETLQSFIRLHQYDPEHVPDFLYYNRRLLLHTPLSEYNIPNNTILTVTWNHIDGYKEAEDPRNVFMRELDTKYENEAKEAEIMLKEREERRFAAAGILSPYTDYSMT